jgi:tetratricopeptide (TPR) repeat protein
MFRIFVTFITQMFFNSFIRRFLFCLLFVAGGFSFAQVNTTSFPDITTSAKDGDVSESYSRYKTKQVDPVTIYFDSAQYLSDKFPLRAIDHINKAIELSIGLNDYSREGSAYLILGNIQQKLAQHELAIENYKKCISTLSITRSKKVSIRVPSNSFMSPTLFQAYKQIAKSLSELNKTAEALGYLNKCFEENFSYIPAKEKSDAKRLLAEIKLKQGKSQESLTTYNEVLTEEKNNKNPEGEIKSLIGIGNVYKAEKNDNKAIEFYTQAKTLSETTRSQPMILLSSELLAAVFREQKNVTKEVEIRTNNMAVNLNAATDANYTMKQNIEIGNAYVNNSQNAQAVQYFEKGLSNSQTFKISSNGVTGYTSFSDQVDQSAAAVKFLAEEYLKQGNTKKAIEYLNTYTELQDSLKQIRKRELEAAINLGTSLGKNQQRIDLLEKERQLSIKSIEILKQDQNLKEDQLGLRNTIISTLVFCIVFLLIGGFIMTKNAREKRRANQLLAIKSLRGQMNPHFIFNALNSVNHYISKNDERAANKYLSDFSKLMRSVMDSSKHDFIPLSEEIETLKLYLELEHARFSDKFDYTFFVDESIDSGDFELPPMIIQPYIENAVWHGLRYLDEKGNLDILFTQNENELVVSITDNGIGRKKSTEIKTRNQKTQASVGIQNIESRIGIMNQLYKVNIRATVADAFPGQEHPGTKVEIFIPKKI